MAELLSEDEFLRLINAYFPNTHPHMLTGRGDDCAVLACPSTMCVSTDLFIEDIHFRRSYFSPEDIGYKALAVNLSDIAASGAVPLGFSVGLMVVSGKDEKYWEELCKGMSSLAQKHNVALTGGDLSKANILGLSVTVWGGPVKEGTPYLQRGICAPDDIIFCIGATGLARTGFLTLEKEGRKAISTFPEATSAHLRPCPKIVEGQTLARLNSRLVQAGKRQIGLMDLSDGLARDIPRLLGKTKDATSQSLGAKLTLHEKDIHSEILHHAETNNLNPISELILGGEDYALLGTCPPDSLHELQTELPQARIIGTVAETQASSSRITVNGKPWDNDGFDHFSG